MYNTFDTTLCIIHNCLSISYTFCIYIIGWQMKRENDWKTVCLSTYLLHALCCCCEWFDASLFEEAMHIWQGPPHPCVPVSCCIIQSLSIGWNLLPFCLSHSFLSHWRWRNLTMHDYYLIQQTTDHCYCFCNLFISQKVIKFSFTVKCNLVSLLFRCFVIAGN